MNPPTCPACSKPVYRALDLPYGWWEWDGERYVHKTQATRVDMAPWVHADCMSELRPFHPDDYRSAPAASAGSVGSAALN